MLYASLFLSAILLALANWIVRKTDLPGVWMASVFLLGLLGPCLMFCVAPATMIQSLCLVIAVVAWRLSGRGPGVFFRWSLAATAVAYGLAGILVYQGEREYARLRRLYPYESIEARLPLLPAEGVAPSLSAASTARLDRLEDRLPSWGAYRASRLRELHENAVGLFINSPGFGIARMGPSPNAFSLATRSGPVPAQPGPPVAVNWSPGDLSLLPEVLERPVDDLLDVSIQ